MSDCQPAMIEADNCRGLGAITGSLLKKHRAKLAWCPSHVGIPGNEIADSLAKEATRSDPADDSQILLHNRGIDVGCLPTTAYRDLRWWRKRISNAKRSVWQTRWNSVKTSLKDWKPEVGPWKSQLSSKVQAEKLLARIRLNRHHSQDIPGKKRTPCRCGARILAFINMLSHTARYGQRSAKH